MMRIFIACFCLLSVQTMKAQIPSPDSMVARLFSAVKTKNESAYLAMLPAKEQLGKMLRKIIEPRKALMRSQLAEAAKTNEKLKGSNVDSLIDGMINNGVTEVEMKKMVTASKESFRQAIVTSEKKGVLWNNATLNGYVVDTSSAEAKQSQLAAQLTGVKMLNGYMIVNSNGSSYISPFEKLIYLPDEHMWFAGGFGPVTRKGEPLLPKQHYSMESEPAEGPPKAEGKTVKKRKVNS